MRRAASAPAIEPANMSTYPHKRHVTHECHVEGAAQAEEEHTMMWQVPKPEAEFRCASAIQSIALSSRGDLLAVGVAQQVSVLSSAIECYGVLSSAIECYRVL